ncbi:MAG: hypothetical protein NZL92_04710 [Gloeomargarita sp. SKYG116]|nr:hypothetical protein [Gloeomargarita sp. SKYG116]MCS7227110.1 hypothetical protein [Gloeomargarita sp. SKYB31]MDW8400976.1 hypothetical protein [Gloeomargarita sp. SKYGB_i_bin116]
MNLWADIARTLAPPGYKRLAGKLVRQITTVSSPNKPSPEAVIRDRLAQAIPGSQTEVPTPYGRIDILTPTEVIEVKRATQWKQAIGQVQIYAQAYPHHRLRIHLFGVVKNKTLIRKVCREKGIRCTFADPIE